MEVSVTLASRAALRTLPLIEMKMGSPDPEGLQTSIVKIFFSACAIASAAARWPNRRHELCHAADELCIRAALEPYRFGYGPGYVMVNSVRAMMAPDSKASAAIYSTRALDHSVSVLIHSIIPKIENRDLRMKVVVPAQATLECDLSIAESAMASDNRLVAVMVELCCKPIWLSGPPQRIIKRWSELSARLLEDDQKWQPWITWYEQVAIGADRCEAREIEAISRLVFD